MTHRWTGERAGRRATGRAWPALLLWACAPVAAGAQEATIPPPSLAAVAGAFVHDMGEGGTSTLLGLRLDLPLLRWVVVEPGLLYTRYEGVPPGNADPDPVEREVPLLLGDLQVQGRYPLDRFTPWVGLGVGAALDLSGERESDEDFVSLTYTGSVGVLMDVPGPFLVLAEARLRGIDGMGHDATGLVAGVALPF